MINVCYYIVCAQENYSSSSTIAILLLDNSSKLVCHYWNKLGKPQHNSFRCFAPPARVGANKRTRENTTISIFIMIFSLDALWDSGRPGGCHFQEDLITAITEAFNCAFVLWYYSGLNEVVAGSFCCLLCSALSHSIETQHTSSLLRICNCTDVRESLIIGSELRGLNSMTKLMDWSNPDMNYKLLVIAFRQLDGRLGGWRDNGMNLLICYDSDILINEFLITWPEAWAMRECAAATMKRLRP